MIIKKICLICGTEFSVPHWRKDSAKYCSVACQRISLRKPNNIVCSYCGKPFHMKESAKKRYRRTEGFFCSKECFIKHKKIWFIGRNNHQYGLKGDKNSSFKGNTITKSNNGLIETKVYAPNRIDADKCGRVLQHRLLVEENWYKYPQELFDIVEGQHLIKKGYEVHHKDGNHQNNDLENLEILSKSEHTTLHNSQYYNLLSRKTGRIVARIPLPVMAEFEEVNELSDSERGTGGYGSTGK